MFFYFYLKMLYICGAIVLTFKSVREAGKESMEISPWGFLYYGQ